MSYPADPTRLFILRARRDTVVLVAAVTAVTFALSSAIHSRPGLSSHLDSESVVAAPSPEAWAGDLNDRAVDLAPPAPQRAPLTSASLVVPASDLALPNVQVRPLMRLHGCDGSVCQTRTNVPVPIRRPLATAEVTRVAPSRRARAGLVARLNPLNHLPDMSRLARPFVFAGNTVTGWFRHF